MESASTTTTSWIRLHSAQVVALLLICTALVSATIAFTLLNESGSGRKVFIQSAPFDFSMELSKTEFQLGENVTIKLELKNTGDQAVRVSWPTTYLVREDIPPQLFDLIITDSNGTEIYRWSNYRVRLLVTYDRDILSGEKMNQTMLWDQKTSYPEHEQIPVGTYNIRAVIPTGPDTATIEVGFGQLTRLETPSVTITIT